MAFKKIITKRIHNILVAFSAILFATNIQAQQVGASAALDSTLMFIGGQMNLTIDVAQPKGLHVSFPHFTDTITSQIEVIRTHKRDTTFLDNNRISIRQAYTITSFDSGLHYIPPIMLEYMDQQVMRSANTQNLAIMVVNPFAVVDPEKGFLDIKPAINLPFIFKELWRYKNALLIYLLIAAILVLAGFWWDKRKIPLKEIFTKEKPKEPAHIIALRDLEKIKKEKIWQSGQVKQFYSQVTDTLRNYIEHRYNFPAMEQTSTEIMREFKNIDLPDAKLYSKLEKVLSTADLAKFAKYEPLPDENDFSLISAFFFVNQTKEEPILTPEQAAKESEQKMTNENS